MTYEGMRKPKAQQKSTYITVRIEQNYFDEIARIAKSEERTLSAVARRYLINELQRSKKSRGKK